MILISERRNAEIADVMMADSGALKNGNAVVLKLWMWERWNWMWKRLIRAHRIFRATKIWRADGEQTIARKVRTR